jgi:hypothetical protein
MARIRHRRLWSLKRELITKSREAALSAIKIFNDPLINFKTETFIVLMIIAWTYMLHAYYRSQKAEYRYFNVGNNGKKIFDRTKHGAFKYWELERCLNDKNSPVDSDTANNLRFLIGLRHEIEHQMTQSLDNFLSGRYQACAINYNESIKRLFGRKYGIDQHLAYSIQFLSLTEEQIAGAAPETEIPAGLKTYIVNFDNRLTPEEYNNPKFSFRLLFKKKLVNHPGQADKVVEFIDPKSELAKTIDKEYWVKKEVERPKFRAKDVVAEVRKAGFAKYRIQPDHLNMWKQEDAKNPAKGYGVEVQGAWYWYENWVHKCIELCQQAAERYI